METPTSDDTKKEKQSGTVPCCRETSKLCRCDHLFSLTELVCVQKFKVLKGLQRSRVTTSVGQLSHSHQNQPARCQEFSQTTSTDGCLMKTFKRLLAQFDEPGKAMFKSCHEALSSQPAQYAPKTTDVRRDGDMCVGSCSAECVSVVFVCPGQVP